MDIKKALSQLTIWFKDYVKEYTSTDPDVQENVDLKKNHTFRVRDAILDLGESIALSEEDLCIAETCALLHDVGRFEQHRRYGTFSDAKSENHATLGVKIIRELDVLKNYHPDAQNIIIRSVGCHNMPFIPEKNNRDWIKFLKLIRDADKIDILFVITEYYKKHASGSNKALEMHLPDTDIISDAVYASLEKGHIALVKDLCSLNDFKLYQMGWVYDLNFLRSYQVIRERKYLKMLRDALPESSQKADKIFDITSTYLDNKSQAPTFS